MLIIRPPYDVIIKSHRLTDKEMRMVRERTENDNERERLNLEQEVDAKNGDEFDEGNLEKGDSLQNTVVENRDEEQVQVRTDENSPQQREISQVLRKLRLKEELSDY